MYVICFFLSPLRVQEEISTPHLSDMLTLFFRLGISSGFNPANSWTSYDVPSRKRKRAKKMEFG